MSRVLAAARAHVLPVLGLALVLTGLQLAAPAPATANPAGSHLVINEFSGGNGTGTGATDEFVELYNPTSETITFTGTIQYKSATGSTYSAVGPPTTFVVAPHGYWLIAGVNYSGAAAPDSRYSFDASASVTGGGHIALTGATTGVTTPANDPLRVDLVGWGTANTPEGTAAPYHPAAGGSLRRTNGVDTDNNSVDIRTEAVRSPRGSASNGAITITAPGTRSFPVGTPITPFALSAAGGRGSYTYAVSSGSLPDGLTLAPTTGQISGTPIAARAASDVTVRATDTVGDPVFATFSIEVTSGASPVEVTSPGDRTFTVGQAVTPFSVEASGGAAPYGYEVTAGSLPTGVELDPATGEVSGTPTTARAASSVTVTVTDADENTASTSFSVGVELGSLTSAVPVVDDTRPMVSEVLTASPGTWGPAPVTLAYQWLADGEEIEDATTGSLTVTAGLVGAALSVRVTGSRPEYEPASVESAETAAVVAVVATLSVASPGARSLTVGSAVVPFSVAATGGVAPYAFEVTAGSLPAGVELDSDSGEISGTPTSARPAALVTVGVTDSDENTASVSFSVGVAAGSLTSALPTIDDTRPMVGEVLAASPGAWGPAPVTLSYQWLADGEEIEDATEASLSVTQDLVGAALSVRVTGSRPEYTSVSVESAETAAVVATLSVASPGAKSFTVGQVATPFSLSASGGVAPYVFEVSAGSLPAGIELDESSGEVSGTPTAVRAASHVGVTVVDSDGNTSSVSFWVGVVAGTLTSVVPVIDDTRPVVGEVLTASSGTWGPAPVTVTFQWLADGEEIEDATGASLSVTQDLVGAALSVRVTGSRPEYTSASVESAETAAVVATLSVASPGAKSFTVGSAVVPFSVEASGGVAPYGFEVTVGSLPAGVVLDPATGEVRGTPTAARAASSVTVTVTDADENTASASFSVGVELGSLTSAVPVVDDTRPMVGEVLTASPGTWGPAPVTLAYQWLADGEEIEDATGASLTVTAELTGAVLSVRATGSKAEYEPVSAESADTAVVVAAVSVASPGAKTFTVGQAVAPFSVEASGGVAPYGFHVTVGSLPAGVVLDPDTGEVSGTPTAARAASEVTVTVTDADENTASATFSISVVAVDVPGVPDTGGPKPGPQPETKPTKSRVVVRMATVVRPPTKRARLRVLADGRGVTGRVTIRVGKRSVTARAVDGVVRLSSAQVRKLVVRARSQEATTGKPTQPRPRFRKVRATLRYAGPTTDDFTTRFVIRVKRR